MIRSLLLLCMLLSIVAADPLKKRISKKYAEPTPVGFWPLNEDYKLKDVSGGHADGVATGAVLDLTQRGQFCSAYKFDGNNESYIEFPNSEDGTLDTKYSMTMMAYVYPTGKIGPIFHYGSDTYGMLLWHSDFVAGVHSQTLYMPVRNGNSDNSSLISSPVNGNTWNLLAATYDYDSGTESLYVNGVLVTSKVIGSMELKTQFEVRMGAVTHDDRFFEGYITCMQLYDRALTADQIVMAGFDKHCPKCGPPPPPPSPTGPPNVIGDPHMKTFDGRPYSFQGTCWYTLVKDCIDSQFEITAEFVPREDTGDEIKTRALNINVRVREENVHVDRDNTVSGEGKHINVENDGHMVTLSFTLKDSTFKMEWVGRKHSFHINFTGSRYLGKLCGLLGNADGDTRNDFQKPDGTVVHDANEFGESWKVLDKT
uniref:Uncharacterized protein LOC100376273 n=1 Tax=Saccoglossus kowalevskii TaxID=10224 RepID=A0ABM0MEC3_SACKO|nr:PREDICTED: uncharacterized protein LOC100376273 [Saccoglossus kowalevskii]